MTKALRRDNICAVCLVICLCVALTAPICPGTLAQTRSRKHANRANQRVDELTVSKVIELVQAGISEDIIVAKISANGKAFDLSADQLLELKKAGASDNIIRVLMNPHASLDPPAPAHPSAPLSNSSKAAVPAAGAGTVSRAGAYPLPADKGAYLWDGTTMHLLYQTNVPSMGSNFLRKFVPFIHQKMELQLIGPHAKAHFYDSQPTILVSGLGEIIPGIPSFRWLYVKTGGMMRDRRIVGTYEVGGFFGSVQMVDNEIECRTKKIAEGIYAITPVRPLHDGEYGLVQVPKIMDLKANRSFALPIWDFGIYAEGDSQSVRR